MYNDFDSTVFTYLIAHGKAATPNKEVRVGHLARHFNCHIHNQLCKPEKFQYHDAIRLINHAESLTSGKQA